MRKMDKNTEIRTLKSLKGDTYFHQFFTDEDIDTMCQNISNDFAIECGVKRLEAVGMLKENQKDLEIASKRLDDSMEHVDKLTKEVDDLARYIADQAHTLNSKELRAKAIELMEDESEYIKYSLRKGYELWAEDKEILIKLL